MGNYQIDTHTHTLRLESKAHQCYVMIMWFHFFEEVPQQLAETHLINTEHVSTKNMTDVLQLWIPSCCSWGSVRRGSLCVYIAPRASHWWTMLRWGGPLWRWTLCCFFLLVKASWTNIFCFTSLSAIQLVSVEVVNEESHPPQNLFQFITAVWKQHTESCTEETSSLAGCHGTLGHVPAGRWMEINRAAWGDAMITTFQMNLTMAHHDLISLLEKEAWVSGRYYNNLQYLGSF